MPVSRPTSTPWPASAKGDPAGRSWPAGSPMALRRLSSQDANKAAAVKIPSCIASGIRSAFTSEPPIQLPARAGKPSTRAGLIAIWRRRM